MLETILRKLGYTKTSYVNYITTDNNYLINVNKKLEREIKKLKLTPFIIEKNIGNVLEFRNTKIITKTELNKTFISEEEIINNSKDSIIFNFINNNLLNFFTIKKEKSGDILLNFKINIINKGIYNENKK